MEKLYKTLIICLIFFTVNIFAQDNLSEEKQNKKTRRSFLEEIIDGSEFDYKGEVFSNLSGGNGNKSVYLDNFDFILNLDLKSSLGWEGARLKTFVLGIHGKDPNEYAGTEQGISNIAAASTWNLYEFWLEQNLFDDDLSILMGLFDLNSEFDSRQTSAIFINPSQGIGAEYSLTGVKGPSIFPNTSLAIRIKYSVFSSFNIKAAAFDAVPGHLLDKHDGLLLTTEFKYKSTSEELNKNYFSYLVGGWLYTGKFERLLDPEPSGDPIYQRGNYGIYFSAEKFLWSEAESTNEGLSAFFRLGFADRNINKVDEYIGAGVNYTGLIPGRNKDVIGLAAASIHNNEKYIDQMFQEGIEVCEYENIVEFTYLFNISRWLKMQPDLQYVIDPTYCRRENHSFLGGISLELFFN